MSAEATQPPSSSSPAAAAFYPPWVLLEDRWDEAEGATATADAKTVAACLTSTGDPISVSVRVAAPPAESRIRVQVRNRCYAYIIAAHGNSVLLAVGYGAIGYQGVPNYFVYSAGTGAANPPSLSLLPPCYRNSERGPVQRYLDKHATGLTRRGVFDDDDLVVASLKMVPVGGNAEGYNTKEAVPNTAAELLLLRHGEWRVKWPMIGGDAELQLSSWRTHKVVTVGDDGLMCWFEYDRGLMFSNVFDETPILRYVPLPAAEGEDPHTCRASSHNLCVVSDGTVKFVRVSPRCCCGGAGATHCRRSKNAYTIRTWTLNMDGMAWVMDGMVDATDLWALDAYKNVPRVQLACPIVSMDEPHAIFFTVCEKFYVNHNGYGDRTKYGDKWMILVDMKSKTLRSVYRYKEGRGHFRPSWVSDYFNSSASSSDDASSGSISTKDTELQRLGLANEQHTDNASNSESASPEKILAALQEVPDLAREDMLKAYSILSHDSNGRRFRSLLDLPLNLRKDWLLMEIKSSEACSLCSACTANSNMAEVFFAEFVMKYVR